MRNVTCSLKQAIEKRQDSVFADLASSEMVVFRKMTDKDNAE
jgi:hypothetical protein